jgi:hypothetical protein
LKDHSKTAKTEFVKRIGPGMNMDDPFGELLKATTEGGDEEEEQQAPKKPATTRTKPTTKGFCLYCGKGNHLTKRSKICIMHNVAAAPVLYSREDGTLLNGSPTGLQEDHEAPDLQERLQDLLAIAAVPGSKDVEDDDAAEDTDCMDSLPFDTSNDDSDSSSIYYDAVDDSDDDSQQGPNVALLI